MCDLCDALGMIILALVVTQAMCSNRRVFRGTDDTEGRYPYVVALVDQNRRCTGTLISPNWVLTAAYCFTPATHIQYGDLTVSFRHSQSKRKILHTEKPDTNATIPNIGLMYVNAVYMKQYGQLSAVDYPVILGHGVEYAGFGSTQKELTSEVARVFELDQIRPLQLGEGVVSKCEDKYSGLHLCLVPKSSNKEQVTLPGDPGGPLFHNGKVVAVHIGGPQRSNVRYYIPVSPYLPWINKIISRPYSLSVQERSNLVNEYVKLKNISQYFSDLQDRVRKYREQVLSILLQET